MNNLYEEMNTFLADQLVLGMKIHNIHWFLKGASFFTVHEKMDEYYAQAEERIDVVAERLLAIGAKPVASLKDALEMSSIKELTNKDKDAKAGFELLIVDFEHMNKAAIRLIEVAEKADDAATADFFTTVTEQLQKDLWMMNAYIK